MSSVRDRLASAGHTLPTPPAAVGLYVPATRAGNLVFTSGQLPMRDGALITSGVVGREVPVALAQECAAQCALNALAAASGVCDLDAGVRILKVVGYVAACEGFSAHPTVINGASGVLMAAFGDAGAHAREAIGVASLPMGAPVEVSIVLEVDI